MQDQTTQSLLTKFDRIVDRVVRVLMVAAVVILPIAFVGAIWVVRGFGPPVAGPTPREISDLKTALDEFEIDNGRYPTTTEGLAVLAASPGDLPHWKQVIPEVPKDEWGRQFVYRCPGTDGKDYDLLSTGPSGEEGNADNIKQ
jgi:general secretion pathway protein G